MQASDMISSSNLGAAGGAPKFDLGGTRSVSRPKAGPRQGHEDELELEGNDCFLGLEAVMIEK